MAMKAKRLVVFCLVILAASWVDPSAVFAQKATIAQAYLDAGFNPEAILDDRDVFELGNMNQARIQEFLDEKGTLGKRLFRDSDGQQKPAAAILWRVATSYKINPRYLLALMQKEQSLVEDPEPTQKQLDWATGYGVCDSCSMDDPAIQNFKGFANQIEWAAKQHREKYLLQILGRGTTIAGYAPGKSVVIDGWPIIPENKVTAMLYSYTPHINGNLNLWKIWRRWFALNFPDGSVVRGKSSGKIYVIRFGKRRPFASMAVASSMVDPTKIVTVEDSQLAAYSDGPEIRFPNYALVELPDKTRWLIAGDKKRLIKDVKVFAKLGFNEDEVIEADASDLDAYETGADITLASAYPTGALVRDITGAYWYIENSVRHAIPNTTFLSLYFKGQPSKPISGKNLLKYKIGDPYSLRDGELVRTKTSPAVFVIENGHRRPIPDARTFEELGWNWKNVVTLPSNLLKEYALGDPVNAHPILEPIVTGIATLPPAVSTTSSPTVVATGL